MVLIDKKDLKKKTIFSRGNASLLLIRHLLAVFGVLIFVDRRGHHLWSSFLVVIIWWSFSQTIVARH